MTIPPGTFQLIEEARNLYFKWLVASTVAVFLGVLVEESDALLLWLLSRGRIRQYIPLNVLLPPHRISNWAKRISRIGWLILISGVLGEGVFEVLVSQLDSRLQAANTTRLEAAAKEIARLGGVSAQALYDANSATAVAQSAKTTSSIAVVESNRAKTSSSNAMELARTARQEADSFEKDIASAKKQATEAESHLAEALAKADAVATLAKGYENEIQDAKRDASEAKALLAEARRLAAEARQQAGEATIGVNRLKANRSLSNAAELSARLKEFENTEYTFSGVFADEESVGLLKEIDEALRRAGWRTAKGTHRFPAIELFGKDDDVNEIVATGVQISVESVESPESLATLQALPLVKLLPPLNAAIALNLGLSSGISPQDAKAKLVNVQPGTSKIVQISVGKKP